MRQALTTLVLLVALVAVIALVYARPWVKKAAPRAALAFEPVQVKGDPVHPKTDAPER